MLDGRCELSFRCLRKSAPIYGVFSFLYKKLHSMTEERKIKCSHHLNCMETIQNLLTTQNCSGTIHKCIETVQNGGKMVYSKGMEDSNAYQEFMKQHFRTKEDVLRSLNKKIKKYKEAAKNDHTTPPAFFTMICTILDKFIHDITNAVLFDELPDWWIYGYELEYDCFRMYMEHVAEIEIDDDSGEQRSWKCNAHYELIVLRFKTLSASEYADLYKVGDGTVRQWIRRGKIRTATKVGAEWKIPVLTIPPRRGYETAQYVWDQEMEDLPEEFRYLNEYKLATFFRDRDEKEKFHVMLVSKKTKDPEDKSSNKELILDSKEREKLELIMISRPEIRYSLRY